VVGMVKLHPIALEVGPRPSSDSGFEFAFGLEVRDLAFISRFRASVCLGPVQTPGGLPVE
jgi:hypothetical protein